MLIEEVQNNIHPKKYTGTTLYVWPQQNCGLQVAVCIAMHTYTLPNSPVCHIWDKQGLTFFFAQWSKLHPSCQMEPKVYFLVIIFCLGLSIVDEASINLVAMLDL